MSSDSVLDFLTEELVVSKNIVTYRSLSHVLGIHINKAKNELAFYHSEHAGSLDAAYATYIIGGEPRTSYMDSLRDTDAMAVDEDEEEMGSEYVPETKITLVSEADLETSKEQYARIDFVHIYCLSPVPIREPALLCEPAKSLREAGTSIDTGFTVELGRVSGPSWYIKKRTDLQRRRSSANTKSSAAASSSKDKLPGLSKAPSVKTEDAKPVVKSEPKDVKLEVKVEPSKPRPSGKLDFSKAAAKPAPKPALETRKAESVAESSSTSAKVAIKSELNPSKSKDKLVENKSALKRSDSEDGTKRAPSAKRTESKSAPRASVKKGVVISDDDDEDEEVPKKPSPSPPPPTKAAYKAKPKAAPPDPDTEKELRAMMDIDDEHVTKVSRRAVSLSEPATSPPATDVELEDRDPDPEPEPAPEPEPKPATRKPRQRRPKKEVPVGRNGLRKRRVVKSRTTTDEKGYFVTEDYSSYESVDEETSPPEKPAAKGKGKGKKESAPVVVKSESEADEKPSKAPAKSAPPLKRKPSKPSVQKGGIASYFAKK